MEDLREDALLKSQKKLFQSTALDAHAKLKIFRSCSSGSIKATRRKKKEADILTIKRMVDGHAAL